ncbi:MAG: RNA 2',3'-cyclic phosphodiesterase [Actinobacteria bacterium]|nr:RNA 2',3'-cyclic phosphodiesterase [Actinomycetota bacterium]
MRLFAAVRPSAEAIVDLRAALDRSAIGAPRLIPPDRWHVTTAFYGEVDERRRLALTARLARSAAAAGTGELRLAGAGHFGGSVSSGRFGGAVLWVGLAGDVDVLGELARACTRAGRGAGIELARRTFRAHLTLARLRQPFDVDAWTAGLRDYAGPGWPLDRLALVSSRLGPDPSYADLESWSLGG